MAVARKYTIEIEDFIAEYVALGFSYAKIGQALKIPENTVKTWCHRKISLKQKIAHLQLEEGRKRLARTDPHWYLERVYPEFRLENTANINLKVVKSLDEMNDDELNDMIARLRADEAKALPAPDQKRVIDISSRKTDKAKDKQKSAVKGSKTTHKTKCKKGKG